MFLEAYLVPLGSSGMLLGDSWRLLGGNKSQLRCIKQASPNEFWVLLEVSGVLLGGSWVLLGSPLGPPWGLLDAPWKLFGGPWGLLGARWVVLGDPLGILGSILGALGAPRHRTSICRLISHQFPVFFFGTASPSPHLLDLLAIGCRMHRYWSPF